jgi:hypothetical protein
MTSRSISQIMSRSVEYDESDGIIELMNERAELLFIILQI